MKRWLPIKSILLLRERIYRYPFRSNYLKNHRFLQHFLWVFGIYINFPMFWKRKKKWAALVKYFWTYWVRRMCLFKRIAGLVFENTLAVNVVSSRKNSWNLQKNTSVLLFHHSVPNWVRKVIFNREGDFRTAC